VEGDVQTRQTDERERRGETVWRRADEPRAEQEHGAEQDSVLAPGPGPARSIVLRGRHRRNCSAAERSATRVESATTWDRCRRAWPESSIPQGSELVADDHRRGPSRRGEKRSKLARPIHETSAATSRLAASAALCSLRVLDDLPGGRLRSSRSQIAASAAIRDVSLEAS
jgi:hypothetical protein